jgi:hypothetical protein
MHGHADWPGGAAGVNWCIVRPGSPELDHDAAINGWRRRAAARRRKAPLTAFIAGSRDATYEAFHEIRRLSRCRRRADGGSGPGWR